MSELIRTIEQCDLCGRFRYPNDLIAYDCWGCGEWAEQQIVALRAEVATLKAELAKYTEPLTKDQCSETLRISLAPFIGPATLRVLDAAIRRVRGAE